MNKLITLTCLWLVLAVAPSAFGQTAVRAPGDDPFGAYGAASELAKRIGLRGIRARIKEALKSPPPDAPSRLLLAELMKRAGDLRAEDFYRKAIDADGDEPAYELFYADYLRIYRGAQHPLFPSAERHYLLALKKLRGIKQRRAWHDETGRRVERGLVALYQEDGLPLVSLPSGDGISSEPLQRPQLFFSSVGRYAQLTGDFDNADDVRAFTSEALLASSIRQADLTERELAGIVRVKNQFETLNRLRFRYEAWPAVDVSYKYRGIERAQISRFDRPNLFNDFRLQEFGIGVEKPLAVSPYLDLFVRGGYRRISRKGLIEFFPESEETVNQYEAQAALSRFVGPDKALLEAAYVFQDINPAVLNPVKRDRRIAAATFTYQLLRLTLDAANLRRFEMRGVHLYAGAVHDRERFGHVSLVKRDYFVGSSLKGLGRYEVTVQPTVFTSRVEGGNDPRSNSQYRTNLTLLWRLKDEEKEPGLPDKLRPLNPAFVHLVFPLRHDVTLHGLNSFENYKAGVELHAKFFRTGPHRTTFLTSVGYNFQRFHRLDKNLTVLNWRVSLGY